MIPELDIWRAAAAMVKRHADSAGLEAATRAHELRARGALQAKAAWLRICRAIAELQKATAGGPIHWRPRYASRE